MYSEKKKENRTKEKYGKICYKRVEINVEYYWAVILQNIFGNGYTVLNKLPDTQACRHSYNNMQLKMIILKAAILLN